MAFGTPITNLERNITGNYGYIVKVNAPSLLAYEITSVQAQDSPSHTPAPVEPETDINTLFSYLESSSCPALAFFFGNGDCWIFFKGDGTDSQEWVQATYYKVGDIIKNSTADRRFVCTVAGTSDSTESSEFATADESTGDITDGTATWNFLDAIPLDGSYPYLATTRFALTGRRKSQNAISDADLLDLPDKDLSLLEAYSLQSAYRISKGGYVPRDILKTIAIEERRIIDE